jgi:peptide methionine sulfoxide reductase MsrB
LTRAQRVYSIFPLSFNLSPPAWLAAPASPLAVKTLRRCSLFALIMRASAPSPPSSCAIGSSAAPEGLSAGCKGAPLAPGSKLPIAGDESIMRAKAHGTSLAPVRAALRWGVDAKLADRICSFNRHYAEHRGYLETVDYISTVDRTRETTYFDSVTGKPLFVAPRGRSFADFLKESLAHGWPSFRDAEVVWDSVRVLPDGEAVSVDGTHLGHNLPDSKGNRYCINLVSVAAEGPA